MNRILYSNDNQGFTLLEVLLTITIFAIVMAIGASALIQFFDIIPSSNERMSTRQLAEINLSELSYLVKEAKQVNEENNTIIIVEAGIEKTIQFQDNAIFKAGDIFINNINSFEIKEDNEQDDLFIITIEKCNTDNCDDHVALETQVLIRN